MGSARVVVLALAGALVIASCILGREGQRALDDTPGEGGAGAATGGNDPVGGGASSGTAGEAGSGTCGNGTLEADEQCDDSGVVDGDGCSAECTYDASDGCGPTTAIELFAGTLVVTGDTSNATDDADIYCDGDTDGFDVFYTVIPRGSGRLEVTLEATPTNWDKTVYLLAGCSSTSALDCDSTACCTANFDELVTADTTYQLGIDSRSGGSGGYTLTLELVECGDGVIDTGFGEECDDGNAVAGDGCSDTCQVECPDALGAEETYIDNDHCYQLYSDELLDWDAARAACIALDLEAGMGQGWDLAAVTSDSELNLIDNGNGGPPNSSRVWIGGTDVVTDLTFVWTTGEPFRTSPQWNATSPNQIINNTDDCVAIEGVNGQQDDFDDSTCITPRGYVCERPPAGV